MPDLSVIVPVRDEAESLPIFHERLRGALQHLPLTAEILYVENGSRDESAQVLRTLPDVTVLELVCDSTKTMNPAAIKAGLDHSQGELILTIDADLQHDPRDIPRFLAFLGESTDAVVGWRAKRKGMPIPERFISKTGLVLRRILRLSSLHDAGCGFRLLRRRCIEDIPLHGEMHRYLPDLLAMRGCKMRECEIVHPPRVYGKTKFPPGKWFRALADLVGIAILYHLGDRPMQTFGKIGLAALGLGVGVGMIVSLPIGIAIGLLGIECILLGLFAEMLVRHWFLEVPPYRVRSIHRSSPER